jgi:hypothetical protein
MQKRKNQPRTFRTSLRQTYRTMTSTDRTDTMRDRTCMTLLRPWR